jgi:hypothetical protein
MAILAGLVVCLCFGAFGACGRRVYIRRRRQDNTLGVPRRIVRPFNSIEELARVDPSGDIVALRSGAALAAVARGATTGPVAAIKQLDVELGKGRTRRPSSAGTSTESTGVITPFNPRAEGRPLPDAGETGVGEQRSPPRGVTDGGRFEIQLMAEVPTSGEWPEDLSFALGEHSGPAGARANA